MTDGVIEDVVAWLRVCVQLLDCETELDGVLLPDGDLVELRVCVLLFVILRVVVGVEVVEGD